MRADRLENKGMHGVVVKLAIKPNRLSELHEDTRTEELKRNMKAAACRRLSLR